MPSDTCDCQASGREKLARQLVGTTVRVAGRW